jgi:plastocyanin
MKKIFTSIWVCLLLVVPLLASAQDVSVTARVDLVNEKGKHHSGNVVLWLTPVGAVARPASFSDWPGKPLQLVQKNKSFEPHVLVVPVGAVVRFPNRDPFFHNVFSLFEGKRFDLGLYEAGSTRDVHFDKPGISYIFCNIHAQMSAVVIAIETPYYAISDKRGQVVIPRVPPGHYTLRIWYEAALPDRLNGLTREVVVSENNSNLGVLRLAASSAPETHKNKYGKDYEPPQPPSPVYERP